MHKGRLEAFSDGVLAIIITIMVLELKVPDGTGLDDLRPLIPDFVSYLLSFIFVGIYWSNHHHLMQAVKTVNGPTLWANLHLLFWLSLIPFVTRWIGVDSFAAWPVALLRGRPSLFRDRLLYPGPGLAGPSGRKHHPGHRAGKRLQGQGLHRDLPGRPAALFLELLAGLCLVRASRPDVAGAGPPHRENPVPEKGR